MPETSIRVNARELARIRFTRQDGTSIEARCDQVAADPRVLSHEIVPARDAARQLAEALVRIQRDEPTAQIEFVLPMEGPN